MKTFYNYNTRENKLILKVLTGITIACYIGAAISLLFVIINIKTAFLSAFVYIVLLGVLLCTAPIAKKTKKDFEYKFTHESFVAHDWGIEYEREGVSKEIKWDKIIGIDTTQTRILFFIKNGEHHIAISGEEPILFYTSLENADFLVNFILKNLAKRNDELNKVVMNKQDLLMDRIMKKD